MPDELAHDAERLARFEREARVLAALNHSNVATLYGFEAHDGAGFLVMELVEGETLADRASLSTLRRQIAPASVDGNQPLQLLEPVLDHDDVDSVVPVDALDGEEAAVG
jgi:serine/threonine protein kinase